MNFSSSVKRWRLDAKLTMAEAAARAGVSQPSWSEWEDESYNGQRRRSTCEKIAFGVGQPVSVVLAAAGYGEVKADEENVRLLSMQEAAVPPEYRSQFWRTVLATAKSFTSEYAVTD